MMTEELLRDLALYKKEKEKAVASAARSVIALFREVRWRTGSGGQGAGSTKGSGNLHIGPL